MPRKVVTFSLDGRPEDQGAVYAGDFAEFIFDALKCLRGIDRKLSRRERLSADYRIAGLRSGSATVEMEPVPTKESEDRTEEIVNAFTESLMAILENAQAPSYFDRTLLEDFKALAKPLGKKVAKIDIRSGNRRLAITKQLEVNIDKIIGEDIKSEGSVSGQLDVVNVHEKNIFFIFPVVGPSRIQCVFPDDLLDEVRAAIKKYVTVSGTLRYKQNEIFPYQIDVKKIEIHPPEDELPTLASLRGIAPDMTGDVDSVEFVRRLRDES